MDGDSPPASRLLAKSSSLPSDTPAARYLRQEHSPASLQVCHASCQAPELGVCDLLLRLGFMPVLRQLPGVRGFSVAG